MKKSTTYNRSEIMKNAWAYVKQHGYILSAAIKLAWIEAKKPTAQQIMNEVEQLAGTSFYNAYLSKGHTILCYFYKSDWIMFDGGGYYMQASATYGDQYDAEAKQKGYRHAAEMFKSLGTLKVFQIED